MGGHRVKKRRKIAVLISSGHPIFLEGMKEMLRRDSDIRLVGQSESAAEAVVKAARFRPDVVVMDLFPNDQSVLSSIRRLKEIKKEMRILGIVISRDIESLEPYKDAGLTTFISHETGIKQLLELIHAQKAAEAPAAAEKRARRRGRRKSGMGFLLDSWRTR